LLDATGRVDSADEEFRRAIDLAPDVFVYGVEHALFIWRRRGDRTTADKEMRTILDRQRDAFTVGRYALLNDMAFDDRQDVARQLYEEALGMAPEDPWLNGRFASFMLRNGDVDSAREYFERAIAGDHPDVDALVYYAEARIRDGASTDAADLLRRALRLRRRDPTIVAMLAAARTLLGVPDDEVEPMYRQALIWEPDHPLAALNLAQILLRRDSGSKEARRLLNAAEAADLPAEMRLELLFYRIAYEVDQVDDAVAGACALLNTGLRVSWDLSREVEAALEHGHSHAELLVQIAGQRVRP
jgi:Flp pilus assembly protein TadD